MYRINSVALELQKKSKGVPKSVLAEGKCLGFTANDISSELQIARNSVSEDLNELVNRGIAVKIKSRPVFFFDLQVLEYYTGKSIQVPANQYKQISEYFSIPEMKTSSPSAPLIQEKNQDDVFREIIGYNGSLKEAIAKLKAAVLYPPFGLNVMLTGEPGVGKTMIAGAIHHYLANYRKQAVPFVYFNCSEYYNNPELLTSHLFGHAKGAFTGAHSDKSGLIEKANGGFLFLDEVHRLTSEGQEKLFTVLDRGSYSRMGETQFHPVNVRFICATTEDIQSAMLQTFLRRIQVVVHLPTLTERSVKERLELALLFFQKECNKVRKIIEVTKPFLRFISESSYSGNIGQMKSDIQFICAQGYLDSLNDNPEMIRIDERYINKKGSDLKTLEGPKDTFAVTESIRFIPDHQSITVEEVMQKPVPEQGGDIFYNFLLKEFIKLRNSNVPYQETIAILRKKIESIFDYGLYQQHETKFTPAAESYKFQDKMEVLISYIEEFISFPLNDAVKNNLRNHFYSLISIVEENERDDFFLYSGQLIINQLDYYEESKTICEKIEETFQIKCPPTELSFISFLLRDLMRKENKGQWEKNCGVVIIAHGQTTASSMADYANHLFSQQIIQAINIPIEQSVNDTLDLLKQLVRETQMNKLILLVDIGSLLYFGNIISEEFQMEVLMIKNINLLSVLELMREIVYETTDFNYLLSVMNDKNHQTVLCQSGAYRDKRVLIITCITGIGTALKIEKLLIDTFSDHFPDNLRLMTLDYEVTKTLDSLSAYLGEDERPLAIIGTFQTELPDVPFIPLDVLFSENGIERLMIVLGYDMSNKVSEEIKDKISSKYIQNLSLEAIVNYINVLNPQKLLIEMKQIYNNICHQLDIRPSKLVMLRFMIHCCCTVERLVVNPETISTTHVNLSSDNEKVRSVIKLSFRHVELSYNIELSPLEIQYIYELIYG
ncbi:sigma 54-interacting transcriptional regulator [Bacillus salipaludis]|uniref:Sigma 54-interacting transcriptional regulator n=1 Tax=Bacillus salipaludis TaxID=2547811 RepID=A0ABW8RPM2_9BACI